MPERTIDGLPAAVVGQSSRMGVQVPSPKWWFQRIINTRSTVRWPTPRLWANTCGPPSWRDGYAEGVHPVRTCVGCRGRSAKAQLIRLVARDGGITVDVAQTCLGRGVYLHRQPECWADALRRRALTRKLPAVGVDSERLLDELATATGQVA